jgi:acyl-[acyl-carrier-protein]-phospholipid O-acyltransferase/long-chain-fatty-acid--[acyl-carrier-protein] ligase
MLVTAFVLPSWALCRIYASIPAAEQVATIIFSSGSTGVPKGVMLTHRNILANVDSVGQIFELTTDDVMVGVLPFFHAFGFTGTLWLPLLNGFGVAYHPNPMDAKTVGDLASRYRATLFVTTPTFCVAYLRKCQADQFATLRYALVGAEKLREPIAKAFKEKFGVDLFEGYGCTEMSPVVAVNTPDVDDGREHQRGTRRDTVGHPLPGVVAKVVDAETGAGPIFGREGLLLVNGPNRMLGYLNDPEKTHEVIQDGWYVTGDIAEIDEAGFIRITDRLSRFSKIGGEMVPHMKIEEQIQSLLAEDAGCVVTSLPDESRGERLVAFYTDPSLPPQALWEKLCETELPRLWLPKRDDLHIIETIPTLGTGKIDLRAVRQLAADRAPSSFTTVDA